MQRGANLTPDLFVPSSIWSHNTGGKLLAYGVKKDNFALLRDRLEQVELEAEEQYQNPNATSDPKIQALEFLIVTFDSIQTAMASHIPYIHAVKKPAIITRNNIEKIGAKIKKYGHSVVKRATRAASSSQKVSDPSDYNQMVRDVVAISLAFSKRASLASPEELSEGLGDVLARAHSFYRDVVCSIIIEDLRLHMQRCIKHETVYIVE
uniref:Uncharacterized protein n=1 Tax=Spongospora subterranea TaxID=70186 RepID=A0A0H5RRT2_9EUKA|eukprot:CRZ11429.1 hypothetical protein [Spongospora subterranea]